MRGQGTPNFMARAVHKGSPLPTPESFPASPVLRHDAASVYKRCYPERFKLFGNREKWPTKVADQATLPMFRHELRHDAESSVLLFFWWIMLAAPQGKKSVGIGRIIWSCFSLEEQIWLNRQKLLSALQYNEFQDEIVHPEYDQLFPLVKSMAKLIQEDYHWVKEEKYKHPEYLHDALQRVILNFVFENKDDPFMDRQKSPEPRQVRGVAPAAPRIYVESCVFASSSSTQGKKRKVSGSVSLSHEPHHDSLTVRFSP